MTQAVEPAVHQVELLSPSRVILQGEVTDNHLAAMGGEVYWRCIDGCVTIGVHVLCVHSQAPEVWTCSLTA